MFKQNKAKQNKKLKTTVSQISCYFFLEVLKYKIDNYMRTYLKFRLHFE